MKKYLIAYYVSLRIQFNFKNDLNAFRSEFSHDCYRFRKRYFICLFSFLSNIDCIVVEQFFYVTCLTLCVRLKRIHEDVQDLVRKAEHPRWRCWANPEAGCPTYLGIPSFDTSDIRRLRSAHLRATETFRRVNRAFQLPLLLNIIDSVCRIVFYTSEVTYHLTYIMWDKRSTISYSSTVLYLGYWGMRIVRLWYLHSCEYYITKMVRSTHDAFYISLYIVYRIRT